MAAYIVILTIVGILAYGIGSMDTLVLASNFVFHTNLRKLGKGNSWISNFRRIYGFKGALLLLATELVKDIVPILIGGLSLVFFGHFDVGCSFAGFCLVLGRLWPIFYNLKGSHATIAMIVAGLFADLSVGIAPLLVVAGLLLWTKRIGLSTVAGALVMIVVTILVMDVRIMMILPSITAGAVIIRHIPEMIRLVKGSEEKLEFREDLSYKFDEKF